MYTVHAMESLKVFRTSSEKCQKTSVLFSTWVEIQDFSGSEKMDTSNFGLFGIFQHPLEPSFQWHSSRASLSFKTSPDSIPKSSSWPSTLQVLILILSWTCVLTRSLGKCTKILHYKMGMNFGSLYRTEWYTNGFYCRKVVWNNLPALLRQTVSAAAFKRQLKTYLFSCAFYSKH